MPIAIVTLDVDDLPDRISGLSAYREALVLVRRGDEPIALLTLRIRGGALDGVEVRRAIAHESGPALARLELDEQVGLERPAPIPSQHATVAVCTRDRPDDLERCLTALRALRPAGAELLVVDSASRGDDTRHVVAHHPGVRYVREERPGLDIARNRALREARGDIIAFCDDDAIPDHRWLAALLRNFEHRRTLCVTGLTLPLELETAAQHWFERTNPFARGLDRRVFDGAVADPFLVARIGAGVNMALRRTVLDLVGAFDEALDAGTPTQSGGDHDMFTRILAGGYRIVYDPAALSFHRHRRDWRSLRSTIRGYGTGVYATLTKHLVHGRELRSLGIVTGWAVSQFVTLVRALGRRPGAPPIDLVIAELRGCAAGPPAYWRARRALRLTSPDEPMTAMPPHSRSS